jgi:hypothetical protein
MIILTHLEEDDDSPEALLQRAVLPDNFKPLQCACDHARTRRKAKTDEADVEWLRNAASEHFGHQHFWCFEHSQNRILQNPDIVTMWKFVVQLNDAYHKKKSGVSVSFYCPNVSLAPQLPHLQHTHALTRATYAPYDTHTHSRAPPTHQNALRALTRPHAPHQR